MLLTDARRPARRDDNGELVGLADQDRSRWDFGEIDEGVSILTETLATGRLGLYQLQAAIAAVHDEAPTSGATDWGQVVALYDLLLAIAPSPMAALSRAFAVGQHLGPDAGIDAVTALEAEPQLTHHHRLHTTRAHLFRDAGRWAEARDAYLTAARLATNEPEQRYLLNQAAGTARHT